jgi:hypothetical protein
MSKRPAFAEIAQRAVDVHVRYYASLGQLLIDSLGALFGTIVTVGAEAPGNFPVGEGQSSGNPAEQQQRASTIVLEGTAGSRPMGVFLVENGLSHEICASVVNSAFTNPAGRKVKPDFQFEPKTIRLAPKEQMVVRMTVPIGKALEPNVGYRGEVIVPDLPGTRLPVVLRRCIGAVRPSRTRSEKGVRENNTQAKQR